MPYTIAPQNEKKEIKKTFRQLIKSLKNIHPNISPLEAREEGGEPLHTTLKNQMNSLSYFLCGSARGEYVFLYLI